MNPERRHHDGAIRRPRWARALAPVAVGALALGLAGCGEDQAPAAAPATTTVTETPTETPTETVTETETASPSSTTPPPSSSSSPAAEAALPRNSGAYADGLVIAWGQGQREEALRYATPEVVSTLFGAHSPGGDHWDQTSVEGAAGTVYVTYTDTVTGEKLELGVLNEASSKGTEHSVTKAQFPG